MILFTYKIRRQGRTDFKHNIAANDLADAAQQMEVWIEKMRFEEPITISVIQEPLPEHIAFHLSGDAEKDDIDDPIGAWQKWKLLSILRIRSLYVEDSEQGKKVEFRRHNFDNTDAFLSSLGSHRHPDRSHEVTVDHYLQAVEEWANWLYGQLALPKAKAFNDSYHIGASTAWWKLITPEALIILSTYRETTHEIHIAPHSPEDEEYGYQFQIDRVKPSDEITLDAFKLHLDEYISLFKVKKEVSHG